MTEVPNHGWVVPRPDGVVARCGGPAICSTCKREKEIMEMVQSGWTKEELKASEDADKCL